LRLLHRLAIPTTVGGGNHTSEFAKSAITVEAHFACLDISKALAATGMRVLMDDGFYRMVRNNIHIQLRKIGYFITFFYSPFCAYTGITMY
jgi:hypothetical protein